MHAQQDCWKGAAAYVWRIHSTPHINTHILGQFSFWHHAICDACSGERVLRRSRQPCAACVLCVAALRLCIDACTRTKHAMQCHHHAIQHRVRVPLRRHIRVCFVAVLLFLSVYRVDHTLQIISLGPSIGICIRAISCTQHNNQHLTSKLVRASHFLRPRV